MADQIVRVAMTDGDAVGAVFNALVVFGQSVTDAPAEEDPDVVPLQLVAPHDRSL